MGYTSPPKPELFEVDDLEATDIDTFSDFMKAEVLYMSGIMNIKK
jgi:CMP-N-acetylneuraminic acid synthetase